MPSRLVRRDKPTKSERPIAHHVSTIQSGRFGEKLKWSIARERVRQALGLGPPARCSHVRDDRDLVQHHHRILDKNRIRKARFGRKRNDLCAKVGETILIRFMLRNCFGHIDRLPSVEGQLAIVDARAHLTSNGRQRHGRRTNQNPQQTKTKFFAAKVNTILIRLTNGGRCCKCYVSVTKEFFRAVLRGL